MEYLLLGLSIGAVAGISPGPLLVLVVTSALRDGWRAGVAAACGPLVTDAVVVLAVLLVLDRLPGAALGVLGVAGGAVVVGTGVAALRDARTAQLVPAGAGASGAALRRAGLVNLLNPHPWVAWATVLGPLAVTAWRERPASAVALVAGFYAALVGAKAAVALAAASGRHRLTAPGYRRALRAGGALLVVVGVVLAVESAQRLRAG